MLSLLGQAVQTLMSPGLLYAGLAAASIPIIIHLLTRLQRRVEPWAAMQFLKDAFRRHRTRLRLEQWLLLLLRCLALALLGLALAGPVLGGLAERTGLGTTERLVCLVIDDSLSTRGQNVDMEQRFESLRRDALRVLDQLNPNDRVAVWLAARPVKTLLPIGDASVGDAKQAIRNLAPRYSRSELASALQTVNQALVDYGHPADRTFVAVVSDFARHTLPAERATHDLSSLGSRARLLVVKPLPDFANVQIASLTPDRPVIVSPPVSTTIPVTVELQRSADGLDEKVSRLRFTLADAHTGKTLTERQREHQWLSGQRSVRIRVDIPVDLNTVNTGVAGNGRGATLLVQARIDNDRLPFDDTRMVAVEWRQRLNVLIGQDGQAGLRHSGSEIHPSRWLTLALQPAGLDESQRTIGVTAQLASSLDTSSIERADAVFVLRPDLIESQGWSVLRKHLDSGGIVWITMPAGETPTAWLHTMRQHMDLDWDFADEVREPPAVDGTLRPWRLNAESPVPERLSLLSADWNALISPVTVTRRIDVDAPQGKDEVWLSMDDGRPLLIHASVGQGHLLFLATAFDTTWTNLPTKPLFVPLLHESFNALIGQNETQHRLSTLVAGDLPTLDSRWREATALKRGDEESIELRRENDEAPAPISALEQPGVYTAEPAGGPALVVNVDAQGGDTHRVDEMELRQWFDSMGSWRWLESDNAIAAILSEQSTASFAWPLLWVVLAVVLVETFAARWFSHAEVTGRTALWSRITRMIRGSGE